MKINHTPELGNQQIKIELSDEDIEDLITGGFVAETVYIGLEKFQIEAKHELKGGILKG